jgi:hypothetical protein
MGSRVCALARPASQALKATPARRRRHCKRFVQKYNAIRDLPLRGPAQAILDGPMRQLVFADDYHGADGGPVLPVERSWTADDSWE